MSKQFLILIPILILSQSAMACPRSQQQFICPGDSVVDSSGNPGKVDAINPFQKTIAINYGGASDGQSTIESVSLGLGCLAGFCVGDRAVDSAGNRGLIAAVNPYNNTVAINYGGASDGIAGVSTVALALGCMEGYCVGDQVVDSAGNRGKIDAINFANSQIAVNYGGASDGVANIQTLSNSLYCETYGDSDRSMPRYPVIDETLYVSTTFEFSLNRPTHN